MDKYINCKYFFLQKFPCQLWGNGQRVRGFYLILKETRTKDTGKVSDATVYLFTMLSHSKKSLRQCGLLFFFIITLALCTRDELRPPREQNKTFEKFPPTQKSFYSEGLLSHAWAFIVICFYGVIVGTRLGSIFVWTPHGHVLFQLSLQFKNFLPAFHRRSSLTSPERSWTPRWRREQRFYSLSEGTEHKTSLSFFGLYSNGWTHVVLGQIPCEVVGKRRIV